IRVYQNPRHFHHTGCRISDISDWWRIRLGPLDRQSSPSQDAPSCPNSALLTVVVNSPPVSVLGLGRVGRGWPILREKAKGPSPFPLRAAGRRAGGREVGRADPSSAAPWPAGSWAARGLARGVGPATNGSSLGRRVARRGESWPSIPRPSYGIGPGGGT